MQSVWTKTAYFSRKVVHFRRKVPLFRLIPPHILSPPSAPRRQKGDFFCRFVSLATLAHGLQKRKRTAQGQRLLGRTSLRTQRDNESPLDTPHKTLYLYSNNKKATYHYGKDYRN